MHWYVTRQIFKRVKTEVSARRWLFKSQGSLIHMGWRKIANDWLIRSGCIWANGKLQLIERKEMVAVHTDPVRSNLITRQNNREAQAIIDLLVWGETCGPRCGIFLLLFIGLQIKFNFPQEKQISHEGVHFYGGWRPKCFLTYKYKHLCLINRLYWLMKPL
jgi:hypothetical protein